MFSQIAPKLLLMKAVTTSKSRLVEMLLLCTLHYYMYHVLPQNRYHCIYTLLVSLLNLIIMPVERSTQFILCWCTWYKFFGKYIIIKEDPLQDVTKIFALSQDFN